MEGIALLAEIDRHWWGGRTKAAVTDSKLFSNVASFTE
jgi:hypothetical protein